MTTTTTTGWDCDLSAPPTVIFDGRHIPNVNGVELVKTYSPEANIQEVSSISLRATGGARILSVN